MFKSSLVKSPSTSQLLKYEINKVSSLVDSNVVITNEKSRDLKEKITKCYDRIASEFRLIAAEYRNCANKSVKGESICANLKTVATNCENQAKFCENRKNQINKLYTAPITEKSVEELNDSIDGVNSSSLETNTNSNYSSI